MKVITAVVNNPKFIELQYHSLKQYMPCDYEYIVFNDAKDFPDFTNGNDITIKKQIEDICLKYNIKCINIPNQHHRYNLIAADRTADSMNTILMYQKQNPDEYLLLDSDMFPIDTIDINKYRNYHCAIVLEHRNFNNTDIYYLWNGIYYFNLFKMENFDTICWNRFINSDTGGMTFIWCIKYLEKYENKLSEKIFFIEHKSSGTWDETESPKCVLKNEKILNFLRNDPRNTNNKFFCEIYDDCFFHYRAGGNWNGEGLKFHNNLIKAL